VSEPRTTEELIALIREGVLFSGGSALEGQEGIEMIAALLAETAHPDYVTIMVSQAGIPTTYEGVDGFREALGDWITPYERFRLEIDEALPAGDQVVFLVRQLGTTKHGGVEIETPSGAVWSIEDGTIRQAVFYLDQRAALRAAGLDPDRGSDSGAG
jgi:ketosteroid isomerase-like protein